MDDRRPTDALTDAALDREIETALAVDPSPEFVAQVQTRVQSEREASWSPWHWGFAAATAFVVMLVVVVGPWRPSRSLVVPVAQDFSSARQDAQVAQKAPAAQAVPAAQDAPVAQGAPVAQDFSPAPGPAPRKAVRTSARRSASVNEPEVIIAAAEGRALRRLFADVRNGLIDLSSLQEAPPATASLQPPIEIVFQPITFEPIASETAEEGERQ